MTVFTNTARVWVPGDQTSIRLTLESELAKAAGGFTSQHAEGGWLADQHLPIQREPIVIVTAYYKDHDAVEVEGAVWHAIRQLWTRGEREVMVEINGKIGTMTVAEFA